MKSRSANQGRQRSRRGITIIEVLIAVSGISMVLALCGVSIQVLMRANSDLQSRYGGSVAIERLARQFREDAHASDAVTLAATDEKSGKSPPLHVAFEPGHGVLYEAGDGGVIRNESRDDKIVQHQTYTLPSGTLVRFELRAEAQRKLVAMVLAHGRGKSRVDPPKPIEIVALQGKDRVRPIGKPAGEKPK